MYHSYHINGTNELNARTTIHHIQTKKISALVIWYQQLTPVPKCKKKTQDKMIIIISLNIIPLLPKTELHYHMIN